MPVRFAGRMMSLPRIELRRMCAALAAAVLLVAGCNNSTSPGHGSVQSVVVTPDSIALTIGTSNSLQAVAQDASAKAISGETPSLRPSRNPARSRRTRPARPKSAPARKARPGMRQSSWAPLSCTP
jgi:hypothetical protein